MDTDDTASREQGTAHESDTALEDIRVLFKDSLDKPIIRCWNEAEVCQIIHDNHETVQFVSLKDFSRNRYTAIFNRRLLTRLSPYFRALLEGGFSESTKKVLPLHAYPVELRRFEIWLSTGKISLEGTDVMARMVNVYIFADYYDILALRREAISIMVKQLGKPSSFSLAAPFVEHVLSSSPLYRFFVETTVQHTHRSKTRHHDMLTKEFLCDIFFGLANKPADKPCRCCHNPCDYHEHESKEEWEKSESCLISCHHDLIIEIHKALLIRSSPYYRALFQGGFSDRDQEVVVMEI